MLALLTLHCLSSRPRCNLAADLLLCDGQLRRCWMVRSLNQAPIFTALRVSCLRCVHATVVIQIGINLSVCLRSSMIKTHSTDKIISSICTAASARECGPSSRAAISDGDAASHHRNVNYGN